MRVAPTVGKAQTLAQQEHIRSFRAGWRLCRGDFNHQLEGNVRVGAQGHDFADKGQTAAETQIVKQEDRDGRKR